MLNFCALSRLNKPSVVNKILKNYSTCGKYPLGSTAVVTGASTGIGLACVKALLENGVMNIVMSSSKNVKKGEEEMNRLRRQYSCSCLCFQKCDVTDANDIADLFSCAMEMYGHIDIVLNNAGIFREDIWQKMIDINLKGVVYGTQLGMKYMSKNKGGKGGAIVNVASILGLSPMAGAPVYTGTKHGVIGFSRSMALPFHYEQSKVRVMSMCPGVTSTPLISQAHEKGGSTTELARQASLELAGLRPQDVCYTGLCFIKMLRDGDTGTIWITENKEIYEVILPDFRKLRKR